MSNSKRYGVMVKEGVNRSLWISPGTVTRLRIHAAGWDTPGEAERAAEALRALNPTLTFTVRKLTP